MPKDKMKVDFEITHRCNKNCSYCARRVGITNFDYLTIEDYFILVKYIRADEISGIYLIGGEPFMHPYFKDLFYLITERDYIGVPIKITTNGYLLPKFDYILSKNVKVYISNYPRWNDDIVNKYKNRSNVFITSSDGKFWDSDVKNPLNDIEALEAFKHCPYKSVRFVGLNQYDCCLAEICERKITQKVHVRVNENWSKNVGTLPTFLACRYCFRAVSYIKDKTFEPVKTLFHDS